jgi:molybdopterin-guanine dinucleotide biosynthesis protein A
MYFVVSIIAVLETLGCYHFGMHAAGYVLAGGRSTRMGRDKALVEWNGQPVLQHMLGLVESATGMAVVLGPHARYAALCDTCWDDVHPNLGPIGGLETALIRTHGDWNLLVSVDTPGVTAAILRALLDAASQTAAEAIVLRDPAMADRSETQVHPLCAMYHRSCLAAVEYAIRQGDLRMMNLLKKLRLDHLELVTPLENLNSREDWERATTVTP